MNTSVAKYLAGALLVLIGILVPSSALISSLRTVPPHLTETLLTGATLFRIGIIILGVMVVVLGKFSFRTWSPGDKETRINPPDVFEVIGIAIILLGSLAVNLHRLDEGLWFDEIVTYVQYATKPVGEIITTYDDQNQHVLFSLLARVCLQIFGDSAWSLRLPAALFGSASVVALYLLGRQLSTPKEALLAAALLAFSYHHVWFSQNARGYTGLLFWTLLATWFFVRALHEGRPHLWLLYSISAALGAYTLIYMLFVILGHFTIYVNALYSRRDEVRVNKWTGFFLGFCLAGFLTFQLYALVLPQFFAAFAEAEVTGKLWTNPLWALLEFVRGMRINFSGSIVAIAALAIFAAGFWSFSRTNSIVIQLLMIPALVCIVLKWGMGHHLWPRSLIFVMGFGALIVVRGAMVWGELATRLLKPRLMNLPALGTPLCIGLILVSSFSVRFAYGPKQDYVTAQKFVQARKEPGDTIVTAGLATFAYKHFYRTDWEEAEDSAALNTLKSRATRTWLIYTLPIQLRDAQPEIMASIERDFRIVDQFHGTLADGSIFVVRSDMPSH